MASMKHILVCVILIGVESACGEDFYSKNTTHAPSNNETEILSPAEELLRAAEKAGYDLTLDVVNEVDQKTDKQLQDEMPNPVAQAFIGLRQKNDWSKTRDEIIGFIFTGRPMPLGSQVPGHLLSQRRRDGPIRNRYNSRDRANIRYNPKEVDAPGEILKPFPFVPNKNQIQIPRINSQKPSLPQRKKTPSNFNSNIRRPQLPRNRVQHPFSHVGQDFGPVTYEVIGAPSEPNNNGFNNRPKFPKRQSTKRPSPTQRPQRPQDIHGRPNHNFGQSLSSQCEKYTDDICLNVPNYPHESILSSLIRDPARADMITDEEDQSADNLVDGISSHMEERYDFTHYFGNRRQDNHAHRDFADDGGYLCPSEVKYARPKRARNSKGDWKYVVNMDKYTQTIRMEKCLKPGGVCSYVSHHYRATCNQIYNYQRLLSWEEKRGLHMDIYKVPSCCSCHIEGYAYVFPPLKNNKQSIAGSKTHETYVRPEQRKPQPNEEERSQDPGINRPVRRNGLSHGRKSQSSPADDEVESRVNYHYHPIIDYFGG